MGCRLGAAGTQGLAGSWGAGCSWQVVRLERYNFGRERLLVGTAVVLELHEVPAAHPGSQGLGLDQGQGPGTKEGRSSETAAVEAVVDQAEVLQVEGCIQDIAYHTVEEGHLVVEGGSPLEPGTAGKPDHPCQQGGPAHQNKEAVVGGVLLAVEQQMKKRQYYQVSLSALLQQLVEGQEPDLHSGQKQR